MTRASNVLTGAVAAFALVTAPADSQSLTTRAGRIAGDVLLNMAATAAFNELRYSACSNENARAQLGEAAMRALDCPGLPSGTGAAPGTVQPSFQESLPTIEAAQGLWTTRDPSSCAARHYTWTVAGSIGMSEFKDQFGQIDIEKTLEVREDMLITETVSSFHPVDRHTEAPGTRWTYVFVDLNHVQVHNLTTGASFPLTRCRG